MRTAARAIQFANRAAQAIAAAALYSRMAL
jgi:hypothetical protein